MENKITLVFDIDGTICPIKKENEKYEDIVPNKEMVDKMREYKKEGAKIVLNTSRNMNSYNGNIGLINAHTAKTLLKWLDKWDIPYDEIVYGKPWNGKKGFYIDDKAIRPKEFLNYTYDEVMKICKDSEIDS